MSRIDLNCDMGEIPELVADGTEEALMEHVTSINVACGAHAGDEETMQATIRAGVRHRLTLGAHPGFPDRANFGRLPVAMPPEEIARTVFEQVARLISAAAGDGGVVRHVKPHGALYNLAATDRVVARAIAEGVGRCSPDLVLVGLAGSIMLDAFREAGFRVAAEAFADRRYEPNGTLRSRRLPGALLVGPEEAAAQAVDIARDHAVTASDGTRLAVVAETICVHGDTPGAPRIAAAVASHLRTSGVELHALI